MSEEAVKTVPPDARFPNQNVTRWCFSSFVDFQKCCRLLGEGSSCCEQFAKIYKSKAKNHMDQYNKGHEDNYMKNEKSSIKFATFRPRIIPFLRSDPSALFTSVNGIYSVPLAKRKSKILSAQMLYNLKGPPDGLAYYNQNPTNVDNILNGYMNSDMDFQRYKNYYNSIYVRPSSYTIQQNTIPLTEDMLQTEQQGWNDLQVTTPQHSLKNIDKIRLLSTQSNPLIVKDVTGLNSDKLPVFFNEEQKRNSVNEKYHISDRSDGLPQFKFNDIDVLVSSSMTVKED